MNTNEILIELDVEIARLKRAREILTGKGTSGGSGKSTGRRHLSAEARARISAAQKKRWAKAKELR